MNKSNFFAFFIFLCASSTSYAQYSKNEQYCLDMSEASGSPRGYYKSCINILQAQEKYAAKEAKERRWLEAVDERILRNQYEADLTDIFDEAEEIADPAMKSTLREKADVLMRQCRSIEIESQCDSYGNEYQKIFISSFKK